MLGLKPAESRKSFAPLCFDLTAHYEPRAGFALSPRVRRGFAKLADRYRRPTFMAGRHSGQPVIQTDIKGIAVGTRIEISRLALRPGRQAQVIGEVFELFDEAAKEKVASGPIRRITLHFRRSAERSAPRAAAADAFTRVFGSDCCFLTHKREELEIGRSVDHQALLEHLWESGPYHSCHQTRVEAVADELKSRAGRYENHRFFVEPQPRRGKVPTLRFLYTGGRRDALVEVAVAQRTEEHLIYVSRHELEDARTRYVTLNEYDRAARRFGTLWVMQGDLVQALDRQQASALYLFLDETSRLPVPGGLTWQELFERQKSCPRIGRASRNSPTFLEMSLYRLRKNGFVVAQGQRYRLHEDFKKFRHVTFYELGTYGKRLD